MSSLGKMSTVNATDQDFRLPKHVVPKRYEIRLAPDLGAAGFEGEERIEIEVLHATTQIVMHAVELGVHSASISPGWASVGDDGPEAALAFDLDAPSEFLILRSARELEPGQYSVVLSFSGVLNDRLCGFYRSTFEDDQGDEHVIATTQFEETDARRAFPCFDEPALKAVFSITIDVPEGLSAYSNSGEIASVALPGGGRRVTFGDTISMSTYIVAFVVGPLEATAPVTASGVAIRVVHVPGKSHLTGLAVECAAHALQFFGDYFGIPYPSDKLDLVALPDFAAGAMENLGCVTFREAILLADPDSSSRIERQRLAEVVEHEIAHMWFGDLVTMDWWNGIWLNEAFATFMALRCQDDFRPEWNCFIGFSRDKGGALAVDGLHATRPIEFPVHRPEEAAAMFDVLTYQKGASVLWMLESYVGEESFRNGVRRYLRAHLYGNTKTTDLWDAIEAEAPAGEIRALMDTWIFQGGYPVIDVHGSEAGLSLSQQPFSYLDHASAATSSAIGDNWLVPLLARTGTDVQRTILSSEEAVMSTGPDGTVVNAGSSGFYRVNYDESALLPLLSSLMELAPGERYNLIADVWAMALSGRGALSSFFAVLGHLDAEEEPDVWSVVIGALGLCDRVIAAEHRPLLARFTRELLRPQLDRVGWTAQRDEGEQEPLLRSSLISALGTIGCDAEVLGECRALFVLEHGGGGGVAADLITAVFGVVAAHATADEFDQILARQRQPESPVDEIRHLNSLAAITDPDLAAKVLELCRTEFRSQNAPYVLSAMLRSRAIGAPTWAYIVDHIDELIQRFPSNSIHRMLDGVSGLVAAPGDIDVPSPQSIREFCVERIEPARRRLVEQSLERLDVNTAFALRENHMLAALLA